MIKIALVAYAAFSAIGTVLVIIGGYRSQSAKIAARRQASSSCVVLKFPRRAGDQTDNQLPVAAQ